MAWQQAVLHELDFNSLSSLLDLRPCHGATGSDHCEQHMTLMHCICEMPSVL
jgi:hypothetical protein